jgi:hypothetical protein
MEPMHALILAIAVLLLVLYVFFWFILPPLWKYVLKPLGKLAYFLLLLIFGISFFMIFALGKHFGIPESVQLGMAVFSAVVSGVKWATKTK